MLNLKIPYNIEVETNPEVIETVEYNYKTARRVCQQLWLDVSEIFADFIRSVDPLNLQDMDELDDKPVRYVLTWKFSRTCFLAAFRNTSVLP